MKDEEGRLRIAFFMRLLAPLLLVSLLGACATLDYQVSGRTYLTGQGIAKYHEYGSVSACKTAFGLDPHALHMRVTAVAFRITEQVPGLGKAGRRGGPYDSQAKCMIVKTSKPGKSVVVRMIDKCCKGPLSPASHQLDLSREAFSELADPSLGNLKVDWQVVDCPPALRLDSDSSVCDDDFYFYK